MRYVSYSLFALALVLGTFGFRGFTKAADSTATIAATASSGSVTKDSNVDVTFSLKTGGQGAGGVEFTYSTDLQFVSVDASGSAFDTEVSAPSSGSPKVSRVTLSDGGANGSNLKIVKVTFKVSEGQHTVSINNAQVIAYSDSSNIFKSASSTTVTGTAPNTSSTSTPTTITPKKTTTTTAPTTAAPPAIVPSSSQSVVKLEKACVLADGKTAANLNVTVNDKNGTAITDATYKPTVTVTPADQVTQETSGDGKPWKVSLKSTKEVTVSLKIASKDVALGTKSLTFAKDCAGIPVPRTTTPVIDTATPETTNYSVLVYGLIAITGVSVMSLIGMYWWNKRKLPHLNTNMNRNDSYIQGPTITEQTPTSIPPDKSV